MIAIRIVGLLCNEVLLKIITQLSKQHSMEYKLLGNIEYWQAWSFNLAAHHWMPRHSHLINQIHENFNNGFDLTLNFALRSMTNSNRKLTCSLEREKMVVLNWNSQNNILSITDRCIEKQAVDECPHIVHSPFGC